MGGLAFLIQLYFKLPFVLLPWLFFDFAEIPVVLSFLIFGPTAGVLSAFVLFLTILMKGAAFPPGPYMKLAAVLATLLGLWIGIRVLRRGGLKTPLLAGLTLGAVMRVLIMTPINYLVVFLLFASEWYFKAAAKSLKAFGITLNTPLEFLWIVLALTALYNALHVLLSVAPTYTIAKLTPILNTSWVGRTLLIPKAGGITRQDRERRG
jgi:riboflavin transporter FmnP